LSEGAIVKMTRAGEVIPYILEVIKKVIPSKPKIAHEWNSTKVDYKINEDEMDEDDENDILVKNLVYFFKKMEIKYVDESIIRKMIDIGLNSINKIINASIEDLLKIENFKDKMTTKVYTNIQNAIKDVELGKIMTASNIFGQGLGNKKLDVIIKNIPNILEIKIPKKDLIEQIIDIDGFDVKTATQFANNLNIFKNFINTNKKITIKISKNEVKKNGKFKGIKFVFTGFRNKEAEEIIKKEGGGGYN
jgi:NAD-dependent DNA ligase